jgi:hypothetical protein
MQTLKEGREHVEAPRSAFGERRPLKNFPNFMALMSNVFEEEINQHVY